MVDIAAFDREESGNRILCRFYCGHVSSAWAQGLQHVCDQGVSSQLSTCPHTATFKKCEDHWNADG